MQADDNKQKKMKHLKCVPMFMQSSPEWVEMPHCLADSLQQGHPRWEAWHPLSNTGESGMLSEALKHLLYFPCGRIQDGAFLPPVTDVRL